MPPQHPHPDPPPSRGRGDAPQSIPSQDASTGAEGLAVGWEPKPVAVLAIEVTWPDMSEAEARHYEPWTLASRWEQRMAEKVAGFGGVVLQGSPSLCLIAFGLPQTLEQLPQRAVQTGLAIRHLAAEARASAGETAGPVVRVAGHLGTLLMAAEAKGISWALAGGGGDTGPAGAAARPCGAGGAAGVRAHRTADRRLGGNAGAPAADRERTVCAAPRVSCGGLLPQHALPTGIGTQARRPFLGRVRELSALQAMLTHVEGGRGQVVGIVGEPGIGKSRLLAEWRQSLGAHKATYLAGHCWSYGSATPYLPIIDLLRAHCSITPEDRVGSITAKVCGQLQGMGMTPDEWSPYLLRLLEVQAGTEEVVGLSPETLKAKTFEALRQLCLHRSQQHPIVLAVEDLHWIDPTSEEFLARLVDDIVGAPILVLATYRPGYRPPWLEKSYATQVTLQPLSSQESLQIIRTVLQTETVPDPMAQTSLTKAQGNPFFLEEIAQTLVEQGSLGRTRGEARPSTLQLPPTLQGVLAARIDRLPAEPKALLQVAAVIGKTCARDLLQRVVDLPDTPFLHQLSHLQRAEFLYKQPASPAPVYTFKHALIQEVAYALLPQARKQTVHERTAQAIEALVGERLAEHYGQLAHHYSRSGNTEKAVAYLQRAGQQAADQSAYGEAITHLTRGLELLPNLPDTPERSRHELDLQITLGQAFTATKGQASPEVEHAFTRAHALCEQVGETAQLVAVLRGLSVMYVARGPLSKARELAEQILGLAQGGQDAVRLARAHDGLGHILFFLGEFPSARAHLDQGRVIADSVQASSAALRDGHHTGVRCRRYGAWTLWYLGYPDQALQLSHEALGLAQERGYPYIVAWALFYAGILRCLRREAPAAQGRAEATMALARQHEFRGLLARGTRLRGWALAAQGQHADGFAQMHQGLTAFGVAGEAGLQPLFRALLAEMSAHVGHATAGLSALDGALAYTHENGSRWYEAELHRLKGELLLRQEAGGGVAGSPPPELPMINGSEGKGTGDTPQPTEAEAWFRQALAIARQQQANRSSCGQR